MNRVFDIAVVGAGPAGSVAAYAAARRGLRVALIDRQTFPRDKTCGDGIGPTAVRAIHELGLDQVFEGCAPIHDVTIFGPRGERLESAIPPIDGEPVHGYVIPRIEFDDRLFRQALAAGAEDFSGHRFLDMSLSTDCRDVQLRGVDGEERTISARLVIGADGAYSAVRKQLDPRTTRSSTHQTSLAMRAYATSDDFGAGSKVGPRLMFQFSRELLPSYGWVFPGNDGRVNIGVGGPVDVLQKRGIDLKRQLATFADAIREMGIELGELSDQRAHQLPHIAGLARLVHPRAVLIGDAASMINPVSGEGIAYAVTAAAQLVDSLPADLADANALYAGLATFERMFLRRHRAHFLSSRASLRMLRSQTWAGVLLTAAQRDPRVLADGVDLLFGFGRIHAGTVARIMRSGVRRAGGPAGAIRY